MTEGSLPRTRGRPSRDDSLAIDRAIAEAASSEFVEHGLDKASMERIASRAGVTKAVVYRRHGDKIRLFLFLADVAALQLEAEIAQWAEPNGGRDALERLEGVIRALRARMTSPEQLVGLRLIVAAATTAPALGPLLDEWRPRWVAPIDTLILTLMEEGRMRSAPVASIRDAMLDLFVDGAASRAVNNMSRDADDDASFRFRWSILSQSLLF